MVEITVSGSQTNFVLRSYSAILERANFKDMAEKSFYHVRTCYGYGSYGHCGVHWGGNHYGTV